MSTSRLARPAAVLILLALGLGAYLAFGQLGTSEAGFEATDSQLGRKGWVRVCAGKCREGTPWVEFLPHTEGGDGGDPINLLFYKVGVDEIQSGLSGWTANPCAEPEGLVEPALASATSSQLQRQGLPAVSVSPEPDNRSIRGFAGGTGLVLRPSGEQGFTGCGASKGQYHVRLYKVGTDWVLGAAHCEVWLPSQPVTSQLLTLVWDRGERVCDQKVPWPCAKGSAGVLHCVLSWNAGQEKVDTDTPSDSCPADLSDTDYKSVHRDLEVSMTIPVIGLSCRGIEHTPHDGTEAIAFVLDVSTSMDGSWRGGVKIDSAKLATLDVLAQLRQDNAASPGQASVSLTTFSESAEAKVPLTSDFASVEAAAKALRTSSATNVGEGLEVGLSSLEGALGRRSLILLTDGQTNRGMSKEQVLAGPAADAAREGVCLQVVGVGEGGGIDEAFLRSLAATSSCGGYYPVSDALAIRSTLLKSFLATNSAIAGEFSGSIRAGETRDVGTFEVPSRQGELIATLIWPGSSLGLNLRDPSGRVVDESYKGARFDVSSNRVSVTIEKPRRGTWQMGATGVDVPGGSTDFRAVTAVRPLAAEPGPGLFDIAAGLLLGGSVLIIAVFTGKTVATGLVAGAGVLIVIALILRVRRARA